ncbi:MAG: tyrosine-type recombinase/integrase [SAR324 cluster bacterium]|nr:tyrosine-type recombinase/integrase [SAR324 cluster bacterium]
MPREKQNFESDEQRQIIRGRFHRILTESGRPLIRDLCTFEELAFKTTSTGRKKRTETEKQNYLNALYEEKLLELETEKKEEQAKKTEVVLVQHVMQKYLDYIQQFKTKLTLTHYSHALSIYIEAVGNHPVTEYKKHFEVTLKQFLDKKNLSPSTMRTYFVEIQSFWSWCFKNEYIEKPVFLEKPKIVKKEPGVYSQDTLAQIEKLLLDRVRNAPKNRKTAYLNHYRIFQLAYYTGMRVGEIWAMKLENISIKEGFLFIRSCPELNWFPKKKKEARVPLSEKLITFLAEDFSQRNDREVWYLDNGEGENHFSSVGNASQPFERIKEKFGFSGIKPVHGFRATVATRLLESNVNITTVQSLLRHEKIETTRGYLNTSNLPVKQAVDIL